MTAQSLAITYSAPDPLVDPYWIRVEQDIKSDAATVKETAAALDALYQIDPCDDEQSEDEAHPEPVQPENLAEVVAEVLELPACDQEPDGSVETTVRVYRSRLAEPYMLRLRGGSVVSTVQVSEPVTALQEIDAEVVTLPYPVVSGFSCAPQPAEMVGNTIRFAAEHLGKQLRATYRSTWDLVTIKIHGVDGEAGECKLLAFFHGLVFPLDLETPELADIDRSLCPDGRWDFEPTEYEVACYKTIAHTKRCTCSGDEVDFHLYDQEVPCPDREIKCPNNQTKCWHLLGSEAVTEWVECAGDSEIPGRPGQNYALASPAYYEEHCCKLPDFTLPQCPIKRTTYKADLPIEHGQAFWRGLYGEKTRFIPVPPPGSVCGEWIIEQRIASSDCCDGVEPLVWDASVSPATIAPGTSAIIGVTGGGRYELTWEVVGEGFRFDNGSTLYRTGAPRVRFVALPTACGPAIITVKDGCSTVVETILCTTGRWVRIGDFRVLDLYVANGWIYGCADNSYSYQSDMVITQKSGKYLLSHSFVNPDPASSLTYGVGTGGYCASSDVGGVIATDPIVGLFSWLAIVRTEVIYQGTPQQYYRPWMVTPGTSSNILTIFEWGC